MPFGIKNAAQAFQRLMDKVGQGLDFIFIYLDDILVFSRSTQAHYDHLQQLFRRLHLHGLVVNVDKCQFGRTTILFGQGRSYMSVPYANNRQRVARILWYGKFLPPFHTSCSKNNATSTLLWRTKPRQIDAAKILEGAIKTQTEEARREDEEISKRKVNVIVQCSWTERTNCYISSGTRKWGQGHHWRIAAHDMMWLSLLFDRLPDWATDHGSSCKTQTIALTLLRDTSYCYVSLQFLGLYDTIVIRPSSSSSSSSSPLRISFESEESREYVLSNAKKLEREGRRMEQSIPTSRSHPQAVGGQKEAGSGTAGQEKQRRTEPHYSQWENNYEKNTVRPTTGNCMSVKDVTLSCIYLNARSICNKMDDMLTLVEVYKPNIIAVTEGWCNIDISDSELGLESWTFFDRDIVTKCTTISRYRHYCESLCLQVRQSDGVYRWLEVRQSIYWVSVAPSAHQRVAPVDCLRLPRQAAGGVCRPSWQWPVYFVAAVGWPN